METQSNQEVKQALMTELEVAKQIASRVKAWVNGSLAMNSHAAMKEVVLLCDYVAKIEEVEAPPKEPINYGDRISRINALSKGVVLPSHRLIEFRQIADLILAVGWELKKGKMRSDIKQWIITSKDGSKAGLYLGPGTGWSLDSLKPNEELKGDLEGIYFEEWLSDNGIETE